MLDLDMGREDDDAGLRELLADRVRRLEALGRVRRRHPNVDDHELGLVLAHELEKLSRVTSLTDDLETGPLEQAREAFTQQDVVVGHDDSTAAFRGRLDRRPTLRDLLPAGPPMEASGYVQTHAIRVGRGALVGYRERPRCGNLGGVMADEWRTELASRENNGISVKLFWSRATNLATVAVSDHANDDYFELVLHEDESPLDVFHHPFAHAAARGVDYRWRPEPVGMAA